MAKLCDACSTVNHKGEPCGKMFSNEEIEVCSAANLNEEKHALLASKFSPKQKRSSEKKEEK